MAHVLTASGLSFPLQPIAQEANIYGHKRHSAFSSEPQVLKLMASHTGYQIINGSKGYKIKSTLVESHGEILDDKKHQELNFLPVLRESTIEIVTNIVSGTEVLYRLKDKVMYLNCSNSDNTYFRCCLETSTRPAGLLDYAHTGEATEIAAPRDTSVKLVIYRHSQQWHSTFKTSIRNCPQKEQVS